MDVLQGSILSTLTALHAQSFTIAQRRRRAVDKLIKYQEVRPPLCPEHPPAHCLAVAATSTRCRPGDDKRVCRCML